MSKLKLSVNTEVFQRTDREEYGTVREALKDFAADNSLKNAKCVPVNATNLSTLGKQVLLVMKEVNPQKKEHNLKVSDTIHVGREISDMIREGEIAFTALLDFPIIQHENNSNGAVYPLVVRPTTSIEDSEESLSEFTLTLDTEVTKAYERDVPSINAILSSMQV